jgi:hypothetical protein
MSNAHSYVQVHIPPSRKGRVWQVCHREANITGIEEWIRVLGVVSIDATHKPTDCTSQFDNVSMAAHWTRLSEPQSATRRGLLIHCTEVCCAALQSPNVCRVGAIRTAGVLTAHRSPARLRSDTCFIISIILEMFLAPSYQQRSCSLFLGMMYSCWCT